MASNLESKIQEKVRALPKEQQQRLLSMIEELLTEKDATKVGVAPRPVWEIAAEISSQVPLDEWEKLPAFGTEPDYSADQ